MSSAMKKGILFVSICVVAILVLYALWPTKMIQHLTRPVVSENDSDRTGLSYPAGGSTSQVIRKKLPDLTPEGQMAGQKGMPLVIVKKLPVDEPALSGSAAVAPPSELSPIRATVADADSPQAPKAKPGNKVMATEPIAPKGDVATKSEKPASSAKQVVAAADSPESDKQPKESVSPVVKSGVVVAEAQKKTQTATVSQPQLKEKPAVHKIADKIVPRPYSIMLASCRRPDSAQAVMQKIRRKGLSPYVVRVDLGQKGIWWRVFEGKYSSATEASDIRSQYKLSESLVKKTPYAIQIGAYASQQDADAEVRRLEKLKHSPYFVPAKKNKQRLLVGAFASKKGARLLADELTARGISNRIVNR